MHLDPGHRTRKTKGIAGGSATKSGREETSINLESRNPATGELLAVYPEHDKAQTTGGVWRLGNAFLGPYRHC
jgi:hypothetical protein